MKTLRDYLVEAIKDNPDGTEQNYRDACWDQMHRDPAVMRAVWEYWFNNTLTTVEVKRTAHAVAVLRPQRAEAIMPRKVPTVQAAKEAILDFVSWTLPDGTRLPNATKQQCEQVGGWLGLVAQKLKPGQKVGAVLTNQDLARLYKRAA